MNPLSPMTYYRRNKRRALLLTALLALSVASLYLVIGLLWEIYIAPTYTINRYLDKFSLVQPDLAGRLDPAIAAQIRANPDVALVLPQNNVEIVVSSVGGGALFPFRLVGLQEADIATVLTQCDVMLAEGQLPAPHTNGVALSQEIAAALDLEIGDTFSRAKDENAYASIVSPLELVGILSGDVRLGILSYEYLDSHERYHGRVSYGALVIAHPGREAAVDDFLRGSIRSSRVETYTRQFMEQKAARDLALLFRIYIPLMLLVTAAITLVVGAINRLAFLRRLPEFGTLHAVGRGKVWLARRLTLETAGLALTGWALGVLMAWGMMTILNAAIYAPRGLDISPLQAMALLFVTPIPLAVIGFTLLTAVRTLGRMDAVAIVERGELSLEKERPGDAQRPQAASAPRPLAATTFYRRHMRQAAALVGAMTLMIVATALMVFILEAFDDARQPLLAHLSRMSLITPNASPLDATLIAQIRAHPTVERAIPVTIFSPLGIDFPPMISNYPVEAYGVAAEDLPYLTDLLQLQMEEGHLPRPNSNEIVIPWTIAQNKSIQVGDVIGDRERPIHPDAPKLPSELVVSGVFAPAKKQTEGAWLSFVSLEFINNYQESWRNDLSLIVVPKAGQEATLDAWLENEIAGEERLVYTYSNQRALFQRQASTVLFSLSMMESIIALVAALALAGLNYIFIIQRQAEFGVLSALGFSRLQLVRRVVYESLFTTGGAWLAGLLLCAITMLYLQYGIYIPDGLKLDFFNPTPWLFTLPVPTTVLAISAGAVGWTLARLDPVSIIERR